MNAQTSAKVVFTGGAGVGKTTLLAALQDRGHNIVGDSARSIIQRRIADGLSPRPRAREFAQEVLQMGAENYERHRATSSLVFFDRSVIDALGMMDQVASWDETDLIFMLSRYPYHPAVFVFPPWQAIYATDLERDHLFEHVQQVDRSVRLWYRGCGYEIVEVPRLSVRERCNFVLERLEGHAA